MKLPGGAGGGCCPATTTRTRVCTPEVVSAPNLAAVPASTCAHVPGKSLTRLPTLVILHILQGMPTDIRGSSHAACSMTWHDHAMLTAVTGCMDVCMHGAS